MIKKCKRLVAVLLCLAFFIGTSSIAFSEKMQSFKDVSTSNWAYNYISAMVSKKVFNLLPNGTFGPDKAVTREEFSKALIIAAGKKGQKVAKSSFADVKTTSAFSPYIEAAKAYFSGYKSGNSSIFKPSANTLREDAIVAVVKLKGYEKATADDISVIKETYSDYKDISPSVLNYIAVAFKNNLMSGYSNGTFGPKKPLTRAYAAEILYKAFSSDASTSSSYNTDNSAAGSSTANIVDSYFALMDFIRTKAWGSTYATSATEKSRVAAQFEATWPTMDEQSKLSSLQIINTWQNLKSSWSKLKSSEQQKYIANWKKQLLSPQLIYPGLDSPSVYDDGVVSFNYPNGWTGGNLAQNGYAKLFIGPGGSQASWDSVNSAASSPSGSLYIVGPITSDMNSYSPLQGARTFAQTYVVNGAPDMKEIFAGAGNQGALVAYSGKFPGQSQEKFYWVMVIPYGQYFILCRMGGLVSDADKLVPSFWNMLSSLYLKPIPASSSSSSSYTQGEAGAAWDAAWAKTSSAVVSNIWAN